MEQLAFRADYFDGRSSAALPVEVSVDGGALRLSGEGLQRQVALEQARVSERLEAAPRLVTFPDGSFLQVSDHAALDAALHATGFRDSWVVRWQRRWPSAAAALAVLIAVLAAGYAFGLPWFSAFVADRIPLHLEAAIGRQAAEAADRQLFYPTQVPQARREAVAARFAGLAPRDARGWRLEFRKSRYGPNAVALPGGVLIVTDELLAVMPDEEALLAVMAHELGHVESRHFLRRLVSAGVLGAAATVIAGDVSGLLVAVPTVLATLAYSRDMERQADAYAVDLLRANGLPPDALAGALEALEKAHARRSAARPAAGGPERSSWENYLSTHPATDERIEAIRDAARGLP